MRPHDIGALRHAGDPRVSPDGAQIAFTVTEVDLPANRYRRRVWLVRPDGASPARPFSAGPDDQLPRWSPDGRLLALAVNHEEGPSEICVLPLGGGERQQVCRWPENVEELAWSPDGARLAFLARDPDPERYGEPGRRREAKDMPPRMVTRLFFRLDGPGWVSDRPAHVVVVPADGTAAPRVLTPGPHEASGLAWSPDGTLIAFASARHDSWDLDGAVDLWTVAADGTAEPSCVTETVAAYSAPSWSPDGTRLAYLRNPTPFDEPRHEQVGVLDLSTGVGRELTAALDRNCAPHGASREPVWIGDDVVFNVEDSGNIHLYRAPSDGSRPPEVVVGGQRWVAGWDWAGPVLAVATSIPTSFTELFAADPSDPEAPGRPLTALTASLREKLVAPERFVARSADGTEVECWAMAPRLAEGDAGGADHRRHPALLNVHGGPFTQYGNRFFDEFQLQVGAGFGVIYCNPRGSSGYSEAWGRAVRWPECAVDPGSGWGGVDYEDVMACVDEAVRRFDWVDPDRLGILGGSYGGYMTSWAIGHTTRFRAACSERACNNLLALEHNSDIATTLRGYVGRTHLEDPAAYLRQSPISYVGDMTTPVLILHSEDDLRCPVNQAEELFVALRLLGREPRLVRFPGETHELSRSGAPRHRAERARIILGWFHEHLG